MKASKKVSNPKHLDQIDPFGSCYDCPKSTDRNGHPKRDKNLRNIHPQIRQLPVKRGQRQCLNAIFREDFVESQQTNSNLQQMLSESEEDNFEMLLQRRHNRDPKQKIKTNILHKKKEEHVHKPIDFKESEYFPEENDSKSRSRPLLQLTEKRPASSMVEKQSYAVNQSKKEKQKPMALKKVLSTSKFKEDNKRTHVSTKKQKQIPQSSHARGNQPIKNTNYFREQLRSHHQDPASAKVKKKGVNFVSKPIKYEEDTRTLPIAKTNKPNIISDDQLERIYFRQPAEKSHPKEQPRIQQKKERQESQPRRKEEGRLHFPQSIRNRRQAQQNSKSQESGINIRNQLMARGQHVQRKEPERNQQEAQRMQRPQHGRQNQQPRQQINRDRRQVRRERQPPRNVQSRNAQHHRRERERRTRPQHQRVREEERDQQPRRNNRNAQPSSSRRSPNFLNFFSQTINEQLQLMNSQFSMMSNIFENFSNFVNINIDTRNNHFHFSSHIESSDDYGSDSSDSLSSDYDDYYQDDSEPQGLNSEELNMIEVIKYKVTEHGSNQCTICLIDLKNGDEAKRLFCEHIFHNDCINEWLKRKSDCPVCRDKQ